MLRHRRPGRNIDCAYSRIETRVFFSLGGILFPRVALPASDRKDTALANGRSKKIAAESEARREWPNLNRLSRQSRLFAFGLRRDPAEKATINPRMDAINGGAVELNHGAGVWYQIGARISDHFACA